LFNDKGESGQRTAILFTIIEACRSRGIDPQTYLREVLTRLPTLTNRQIKDVTPSAWAKAQKNAHQRQAA
jgi:transposase